MESMEQKNLLALPLLILLVLSDLVLANQKTDNQVLPLLQNGRMRRVDVKHIVIDLRFDWQKRQAYGVTTITLAPLAATNQIALDAGMFKINSVTSPKGAALKYEYDGGDKNDNLRITLEREYKTGEEVTLKIDYRTNWVNEIDPNSLGGNNGKGLRFSKPTSNDPNKPKEIWSIGDPESNRYWFPGYDAPDDTRTTEFIANVDKNLTVVSNGKLVAIKDNADGTRTFHWKADTPYPNHLTSFVVGEYVNVKKIYGDVELNNYGYPQEKDWVDASTERLPDMVAFFSEKTGIKYPYSSYSQVFVQDIGSFTANMNTSTITENMVDDYPTHADYFYLWDLTEAEALASQWFGSYITARDWGDIWLSKGFAHYFNCLYTEHKNGRDEWLLWVHAADQWTYFSDWNSGNRQPVVNKNYDDVVAYTSGNYPAIRGGMVLNILRKHLGEAKWWKAIQHYVKANADKQVTTADFQRAVEEATGERLAWFFDQWIYKMGHPVFEVTKKYDRTKRELTISVRQAQKIDKDSQYPQVEFFQGKIEIEIDDRIEQVWLEAKAENVFTFTLASEPKFVNFDFENTWIRELKFEKSFDELLNQLNYSRDPLAKRSAMIELTAIAENEKTTSADRLKVIDSFRNILGSSETYTKPGYVVDPIPGDKNPPRSRGPQNVTDYRYYWRLRLAALTQLQRLVAPASQTKPAQMDEATTSMLLDVIKNDKSWVKATAVTFLGMTRDPKYADMYIDLFNDESFRVITAAAIALGQTKSPKAFEALVKLKDKPSMKSQSLIAALRGLSELGDPRGYEVAYAVLSDLKLPRWRLPTISIWDYRVFAAQTIASLGKSEKAFPLIFDRFKRSMIEDDMEGIFYNLVLISTLADSRGQEAFDMLKAKYKDDTNVMAAANQYEAQFKSSIGK